MSRADDVREAFALFDKKGTGTIQREDLGDLLRALGQNPTQADVATLASRVPNAIDFNSFNQILNRPGGYDPAGTVEEFVRGFAVFDKDGSGHIGAGEMRYVLTSLGEKLSDDEVDELLRGVKQESYVNHFINIPTHVLKNCDGIIYSDGSIDYRAFVTQILAN